MENTLFPIKMEMHIIFAVVATLIFIVQFIRLRKKYHLVLAAAIPATLLAYVIDSRAFFYGLGIAEAAALIAALVLCKTIDRDPPEPETTPENPEAAADAEAQPEEADKAEPEIADAAQAEPAAAEESEA